MPTFPPDYGYIYDSQGKRSLSVQVNMDTLFPLMRAPYSSPEVRHYRRSYSSGRGHSKNIMTPTLGILAVNEDMGKSLEKDMNIEIDI